MQPPFVAIAMSLIFTLALPSAGAADVLISETEAKLPGSPDIDMTLRGLTRGPRVEQVSPNPAKERFSPLPLKVKFIARNNVAIDLASVKVIYLKVQSVDLTERIKKYLTADGIDMPDAEMPPGTHHLQIFLQDKQDRSTTAIIKLIVSPR